MELANTFDKMSERDMENPTRTLKQWLSLKDLTYDELKIKLGINVGHIERAVSYQKLTGLTRIFKRDANPARFYFIDQELILIYVISPLALANLTPIEIKNHFEQNPVMLKSRTGKTAKHVVFAEGGLAFSEDSGRVIFLEIFPPTDIETYKEKIYQEPEVRVL